MKWIKVSDNTHKIVEKKIRTVNVYVIGSGLKIEGYKK
jgi:hypothetical protein